MYRDGDPFDHFEAANMTTSTPSFNVDGKWFILAAYGDELMIAARGEKPFTYKVGAYELKTGVLEFDFNKDAIDLEAVTVVKDTTGVAGFMNKHAKIRTPAERKVYQETFEGRNALQVATGIISGASLDPIINLISGRSKTLKKELKAERQLNTASMLEEDYGNFILETLQVPEDKFGLFIFYVAEKNRMLYANTDRAQVERMLRNYYMQYLNMLIEDQD
ncbi:hypothetical protein DMZ48_02455 [Robertkochia solimangrovi]|nr:hypothetical protein DMZ48_02455 [Robertkochia solimangrovi]